MRPRVPRSRIVVLVSAGIGVLLGAARIPLGHAAAVAGLEADVDGDRRVDAVTLESDGHVTLTRGGAPGAAASVQLELHGASVQAGALELKVVSGHRLLIVRADDGGAERPAGPAAVPPSAQPSRPMPPASQTTMPGPGAVPPDTQLDALIAEWRGGRLEALWTGSLGPQGRDAEWSRSLEVRADGVILFEERLGIRPCGDPLGRLNPRRLDLTQGRFRPVSAMPTIPAGARQLTAVRGRPGSLPAGLGADTEPATFRFEAASTQAGDGGSADGLTAPRELDDGKLSTVWSEGRGGFGRGDFLTARAGVAGARAVALRVVPGDASSEKAFLAANRLKRLLVVTEDGPALVVQFRVDPAADRTAFAEPFWVTLPAPLATGCVTVFVDDVYPGRDAAPPRDYGRTAIAELAVLADLDAGGTTALAGFAERVALGEAGASDAEHLLRDRGRPGTAALLDAARKPGRPIEQLARLRQALARIGDPTGAAEVAADLGPAARRNPEDLRRDTEALVAMGEAAVGPLAEVLADSAAPETARAAAAVALGRVGAAAARLVLEAACGRGPDVVRRAVTRALGTRAPAELPPALAAAIAASTTTAAPSPPAADAIDPTTREADLWRAVGLLARHVSAGPDREAAAHGVAARLTSELPFELRYRLAQAAAVLAAEPAGRDALGRILGDTDGEPALRKVALEALGQHPSATDPAVQAVAVVALGDPDPGVRAAAAEVLATGDTEPAAAPLLGRLASDRWPMVRRATATALGRRCRRPAAADGLYRSVDGDADLEVRRAALTALVACREPRISGRLLALAGDAKRPTALREQAASLVGVLGDRALVPATLRAFDATRRQAFRREEADRVAAALARTLGRLGDPRAVDVLVDAAADGTFPVIQAAAVAALGTICPPGIGEILRRAAHAKTAPVVRAARQALETCKP